MHLLDLGFYPFSICWHHFAQVLMLMGDFDISFMKSLIHFIAVDSPT